MPERLGDLFRKQRFNFGIVDGPRIVVIFCQLPRPGLIDVRRVQCILDRCIEQMTAGKSKILKVR